MGQGCTPGWQQSLPQTLHQPWEGRDRQLTGSPEAGAGRGAQGPVNAPGPQNCADRGGSQVRPGLGGLPSPSPCSSCVSVLSPGALDLRYRRGGQHAPVSRCLCAPVRPPWACAPAPSVEGTWPQPGWMYCRGSHGARGRAPKSACSSASKSLACPPASCVHHPRSPHPTSLPLPAN